ncbi:MAG: hypothetical protein HC900_07530 [Methylacidiphilales bacterium]|nr:hypothetical protein [Candidatus Methylacidiphilales bacterium]
MSTATDMDAAPIGAHSAAMQTGAHSSPSPSAAGRFWPVLAGAAVLATAFAAGLLWATQGGAVFFEVVAAGIAACF